MMDSELKTKWVAALRSGDYKQGKVRLRTTEDKYCCLGVLYEIAGGKWKANSGIDCYFTSQHSFNFPQTSELFGLDRGMAEDLAQWNDSGKDFNYIADKIEASVLI